MAKTTTAKGHAGLKVGITAAAAALAAGAYWLYGSQNAEKHRKQAKGWMLRARGEVLEGMEKLKHIDKAAYTHIVDGVMKRYEKTVGVSRSELAEVRRELRDAWSKVHEAGTLTARVARKVGRKVRGKKARR
ncbi:MAG: hypothetical protein Q7R88_03345 [bacterium]|nr:hypothetical protein [bacterium]